MVDIQTGPSLRIGIDQIFQLILDKVLCESILEMDELPKLPGYCFESRNRSKYHLSHTLNYRNGYRVPEPPMAGIGGERLSSDSVAFVEHLG